VVPPPFARFAQSSSLSAPPRMALIDSSVAEFSVSGRERSNTEPHCRLDGVDADLEQDSFSHLARAFWVNVERAWVTSGLVVQGQYRYYSLWTCQR
jgi:hypothetical protein